MSSSLNHPPTIADVAYKAGVSIATVSRVLTGSCPVLPETAESVRAAIAELKYVPRAAARVLASHRTNTIGLLMPDIGGAFFTPMLRGVEAGAREEGFDLLIHTTQSKPFDNLQRKPLGEHNTDGLLVLRDSIDEEEIRRLYAAGFPLVLIYDSPPENVGIPFVEIENKSSTQKLVEHLIDIHARKRIVFLGGPTGADPREEGYREALQGRDIPIDSSLMIKGEIDENPAARAIHHWLMGKTEFDAVFTGDDQVASGVLHALQEAGKRVPEDVSVVGFNDAPFSQYLIPPLTTIHVPDEQVGLEAVRQLTLLIRNGHADDKVLLPAELVIRQSCGCQPEHPHTFPPQLQSRS
jgi:LacI family transcriptional regulator